MRKTLPKTEDVARAWANQSQPEGRAASASFDFARLFSYSTCVARLVPGRDGKLRAMVSHHRYSNSTAVVIGQAITQAKAAGLEVFEVDKIGDAVHLGNLKAYEERISDALQRVERARNPDHWRLAAQRLINEATAYSEAFAGGGWQHDGPPVDSVLSKAEREARA